jgi:hypothetical protein
MLRDVARLLVKLAGLIVIAWTLIGLPGSLERALVSLGKSPVDPVLLITLALAPAAVSLVGGLAMFWGSGLVVDRALLAPGRRTGEPAAVIDLRALEEIAFSVIGVIVLVDGLAECVYYWAKLDLFYRYIAMRAYVDRPIPQTEFAGISAGVTRVLLGLALIFLSRGLVTLRRRVLALRSGDSGDTRNSGD